MPRITHVKKAQQRFETKPVIDPATGEQKRTPVMSKGKQKTTSAKKGSRPIFMDVTEADKTRPKPNLRCDFGGCGVGPKPGEIVPGQPYKHISPKSGPYSGKQRNRHEEHPSWNQWEYSSSLSARVAQIESHIDLSQDFDDMDAVQAHLEEIAEEAESLGEEKTEAGQNMEDGFEHETEASNELKEQGEALKEWADTLRSTDIPEYPEPESETRYYVVNSADGTHVEEDNAEGYEDEEEAQAVLDSMVEAGQAEEDELEVASEDFTPEEPTEEQIDEWKNEVEQIDLGDPGV